MTLSTIRVRRAGAYLRSHQRAPTGTGGWSTSRLCRGRSPWAGWGGWCGNPRGYRSQSPAGPAGSAEKGTPVTAVLGFQSRHIPTSLPPP